MTTDVSRAGFLSTVTALLAVGVLAGCTGGAVAPGAGRSSTTPSASATTGPAVPTAVLGRPFRNGSFEITVTKVLLGVPLIDVDATAKSGGVKGYEPKNGQFIVVYASAKNVGRKPASMSSTDSTLTDGQGTEFAAGGPYLMGVVGQGFGEQQQPGTTRSGWIAFDVPPSVTKVGSVTIQSDAYLGSTNVPTSVAIDRVARYTKPAPSSTIVPPSTPGKSQKPSPPVAPDSAGGCDRTLSTYPILRPGSSGRAVRALQCFLNDAGYGPVVVDGQYGPQTRAAVARLESASEGPTSHSGRINNVMWVALISRSLGNTWLRQGDTGAQVRTLQRALRAGGSDLVVDGDFGPQTTAAVKGFQRANGLIVDGVVGDQTFFALKGGAVLRAAN